MSKANDLLEVIGKKVPSGKYKKELLQIFDKHNMHKPYDYEENKNGSEYIYSSLCHYDSKDSRLAKKIAADIDKMFKGRKAISSDTSTNIEELGDNLYCYIFETAVRW